jgi:hypothetical protein
VSPTGVSYDAATFTARFTFATPLPDGNYRAAIAAGDVKDGSGQAMASSFSADFFVLAGDATGDRVVNFNDLLVVAKNYNTAAGATWADGDFDGDGAVNFNDLLVLASAYNKDLPAPAPAPAPVVAAVAIAPATAPAVGTSVLSEGADDEGKAGRPLFSTTRYRRPAAIRTAGR